MRERAGLKERIWGLTDRIPVIRETADPVVATVLLGLVGLTIVGICVPHTVFPHDASARTHVLQLAGGLLFVFGAYYTGLTIRDRRAHEYLERLAKLIEQLDSKDPAVRIGTIRLLQGMAFEKPALPRDSTTAAASTARLNAILDTLTEIANGPDSSVSSLAKEVFDDLSASHPALPNEPREPDLA
jgi:hypothetical protein